MAELLSAGRKLLGGAAVGLAAIGLGGCALKGGQNVSLVEGKTLFIKNCAACHTLARANAKGVVGPNLDDAWAEALSEGFGRNVITGIVTSQVEYPSSAGVMPKLPLSTREVSDIAHYVAFATDKTGQDPGLLGDVGKTKSSAPGAEKNGTLAFAANPTGQLLYTFKTATATAGPITITMTNNSGVDHDLAIQSGTSGPVLGHTPIEAKGTATIKLNLKAGSYTYFCQVPGHREAGMYGTLTVK